MRRDEALQRQQQTQPQQHSHPHHEDLTEKLKKYAEEYWQKMYFKNLRWTCYQEYTA
jgi:hypothetical protein